MARLSQSETNAREAEIDSIMGSLLQQQDPAGFAIREEAKRRFKAGGARTYASASSSPIPSSYFPAATGQVLASSQGFNPISPDQNPAYQAAIKKGRPDRGGFTTISTPSGGTMSVPVGQKNKYTNLLYQNNPIADTGFGRPDAQTAFAMGDTGAIPTGNTPFARSYRMGFQGEGPVQQSPTTFGYQAGQALAGIPNALSGFASNVASMFNKGGVMSGFGAGPTNAGMYQPQPNNALAAVQNFQQRGQFNRPIQPRRYFDPNSNYGF